MNRLAGETSPYLRQHAANPVDWYPWSDAAFERARAEAKPVFLSVGYASCHWCHVMAHESFDDESTATLMNELFVNVKVDREERPDVDAVYMQAVQALTGRGGWPMSVWLTPDGRPFYGGTYYPPDDRHGLPSFRKVCAAVADAWRTRQSDLVEQADRLTEVLSAPLVRAEVTAMPGPEALTRAHEALRDQFDPVWGGFGGAPKFPPAMALGFLARVAVRGRGTEAASEARRMLTTTLDAMAAGGIHDHVGGGFARYAVDGYWLIPHFEKMLYDNALLARAYLHGYLVTGEPRYRRVVEDTIGYVLRELRHPDGGFFSAEDADSEGEEGRFYVWDPAEIEEVCGDDAPEVIRYFGVTAGGNFEGRNVLHITGRSEEPSPAVERGLARLFDRRGTRVRPGVDDKVLLGWNALFLRALAEAGAALDHPDWIARARTTARFLLTELRRDDGRLLRSWKADAAVEPGYGRARTPAFAEDYGALLEALVTLAEVDDVAWIDEAVQVADELVRLFHDPGGGGFFTTGDDAPSLVVRLKDLEDGATPSANSLAANGLLRLASMTGDERYAQAAASVLRVLAPWLATHPRAFAYALEALERHVGPSTEVAVVGSLDDPATAALRREVLGRLLPATVIATAPPGAGDGRTPLLEGRGLLDGRPAAYVCRGFVCRHPVAEPEALRSELDMVVAAP